MGFKKTNFVLLDEFSWKDLDGIALPTAATMVGLFSGSYFLRQAGTVAQRDGITV